MHTSTTEAGSVTTYAELRARLLAGLDGTVLEIGPGSGANLAYYQETVRWIGIEPTISLHERLRRRVAQRGLRARLLSGVAERIDLPDGSADAVVGTHVLCSVDDQARALAEIWRVLKPSGRYVFVEHVAAPAGTWTRRAQEFCKPLSHLVFGCDPARETGRTIEHAGFSHLDYEACAVPAPFGITVPHIAGMAFK